MEGVSSVSTSEVSVRGKAVSMLYDEYFSFLETGQNVYFFLMNFRRKMKGSLVRERMFIDVSMCFMDVLQH